MAIRRQRCVKVIRAKARLDKARVLECTNEPRGSAQHVATLPIHGNRTTPATSPLRHSQNEMKLPPPSLVFIQSAIAITTLGDFILPLNRHLF